jgi:alpha-beta hydrolase superfamily lysophospholipase
MGRWLELTTAASRRLARWAMLAGVGLIALCLTLALGFTLYAVSALPDLQPWHTERLAEEFSAYRHGAIDFDGYLRQEARLFDELRAKRESWTGRDEAWSSSRYNPGGAPQRLAADAPFNRSFELRADRPQGSALLIHGLTDSPYSVKALAESLHARGFDVIALRLPGHGTLPSMMTEMSFADWSAAVRIAARAAAMRAPAGAPFYIGGYSTGGTLSLLYALQSLDDPSLRRPDRVLLVSPAITLTPVAALANVIDLFSVLPIPVLEKVRWQEVLPEYDPYKFNSFPVNASRQVNRATRALQGSLIRAVESGSITRMPPVVAWQSIVDSTVGSVGTVDFLFSRLAGAQHLLVLFDVNRSTALRTIQRPAARELIERTLMSRPHYTLDVVTNADAASSELVVHRVDPSGGGTDRHTGLTWPLQVVSLGHVALPFPPDDPVYGVQAGSGREGIPSIGSWLLRGESGATVISLGSLTRLRSNPFWSLIEHQLGALVESDLALKR